MLFVYEAISTAQDISQIKTLGMSQDTLILVMIGFLVISVPIWIFLRYNKRKILKYAKEDGYVEEDEN